MATLQDLDKCAEDIDTTPLMRVTLDLAAIFRAARAQGTLTSSGVERFAQYINDLLCEDPRVPASKLVYAEESNFYYSKLECWIVEKYAYSLIAQDLANNSVLNGAKKKFQLREAWTDPLPMKISESPQRYSDYKEEYRIGYQHYSLAIVVLIMVVLSILYSEWIFPVLFLLLPGILLVVMFVAQETGNSIVFLIEQSLETISSSLNLGERIGLDAHTIVYVEYATLCIFVFVEYFRLYPQCMLEKAVAQEEQDIYSYLYNMVVQTVETSPEKVFSTSLLIWNFFTLESMTPLLFLLTAVKYIFHLQPHCFREDKAINTGLKYFAGICMLQRICALIIKYGFSDMETLALRNIEFADMDDKGMLIISFLDSLSWQSVGDNMAAKIDVILFDLRGGSMAYDLVYLIGYSSSLLALLNSKNLKDMDNYFIRNLGSEMLSDVQHLVVFVVCIYPYFADSFTYSLNDGVA